MNPRCCWRWLLEIFQGPARGHPVIGVIFLEARHRGRRMGTGTAECREGPGSPTPTVLVHFILRLSRAAPRPRGA